MVSPTARLSRVLVFALVLLAACRRTRPQSTLRPFPPPAGPAFPAAGFTFCRDDRVAPVPARVQILLDSSGSMVGVQKLIPQLTTWMQHSLSLLRRSSLEVREGRVCQFSTRFEKGGTSFPGQCSPSLTQPLQGFQASGDTNLHRAIESAAQYDLTLILTDGVAATGSGGAGDCASGVDAGCVARNLRSVVTSRSLGRQEAEDWGFWLVPVVVPYNGKFFTEQKLAADTFDPKVVADHVRADTGRTVTIGKPYQLRDGELAFESYQGPRAMLLIVLARSTTLGRGMVQALWERTDFLGIRQIRSLKDYSGSLSALPPMELFPGLAETLEWHSLAASTSVAAVGTIDATLAGAGSGRGRREIQVSCPPKGRGEGYFSLLGEARRTTKISGCVQIQVLPAIKFGLEPQSESDREALSTLMPSYQLTQPHDLSSLDLKLSCGPAAVRTCESPIPIDWRASMHYETAADCLADPQCEARAPKLIRDLSTLKPQEYPDKIYGIAETLQEFFRLASHDVKSQSMGHLSICRERN
jgi:hypothetical protein